MSTNRSEIVNSPESFFRNLQFAKGTDKKRQAFEPFIAGYNEACKQLGYNSNEEIQEDIKKMMTGQSNERPIGQLMHHMNQLFTQCMGTLKEKDQFAIMKQYTKLVTQHTIPERLTVTRG